MVSEGKIKRKLNEHAWSLTLARTIQQVSKIGDKKGVSKEVRIQTIIKELGIDFF